MGLVLNIFVQKQFYKAIINTLAIISSTSTLGVIISFSIWTYYFFQKMVNIKQIIFNLFLCLLLTLFFVEVVLCNDVLLNTFMGKINSIVDGEIIRGTSLYERMFAGWDVFSEFSLLNQLFGCGYRNIVDYVSVTGVGLKYYTRIDGGIGYMSCLPQMFCELGICGVYLYFSFMYSKLKGNFDNVVIAFCIMWLLMSVVVDGFESMTYLTPMVFSFLWVEKKRRNN